MIISSIKARRQRVVQVSACFVSGASWNWDRGYCYVVARLEAADGYLVGWE